MPQSGMESLLVTLYFAVLLLLCAYGVHRAHLAAMRWNEAGLRADLDSEFLHDWRVAVRRTRCLLGQLKQVFPAGETRRLRSELGWLARLTGPLRDLDVFLLLLLIKLLLLLVDQCVQGFYFALFVRGGRENRAGHGQTHGDGHGDEQWISSHGGFPLVD